MSENPTVVFTDRRKVEIEDRPIPAASAGELQVRTRRTLISSGTELTILSGEFPEGSAWARYGKIPFTPGYCNIGEVAAVGEGVDTSWLGRRVAGYGSHTRWFCMAEEDARPILREEVTDEQAVFFTIAEIAQQGVRRGGVTWGECAVVYGLGLVGQLTARICRLAGARPVFGVDVAERRLDLLPRDSMAMGLNAKTGEVAERIREATRGRMADVVFEVTGAPDVIPREFEALRPLGRMVVLSSPRGETSFDFHDLCNSPSYTIIGAHNGSHPRVETRLNPWTRPRDNEMFFDWLADGELDVERLISHREPWSRAPELYAMLLADRSEAMGVVLEWA